MRRATVLAHGNLLATYDNVYGLGQIARTDSSGGVSYSLYDGLGSTTGLANNSGSATDTYTYDAFGATRSHSVVPPASPSGQPFLFTGQLQDTDTTGGLYYLRARYYDPSLGRFWTKDPLSIGVQPYAYAADNPVMYTDPLGLCRIVRIGPGGEITGPGEGVTGPPLPGYAPVLGSDTYCPDGGRGWNPLSQLRSIGRSLGIAAAYCPAHLFECIERGEMAGVGVDVTVFGGGIVVGGCFVIAPVVGAATAGVLGIATCGGAAFAGTTVIFGGGLILYSAFRPWHHDQP